jgi:hypothetical protein
MDIEQVNKAGRSILEVLSQYKGGQPEKDALREIDRLAEEARYASDNHPYVSQKARSIKTFAANLYPVRKHAVYTEGYNSGADKLRSFIFSDASTLAHWRPIDLSGSSRRLPE